MRDDYDFSEGKRNPYAEGIYIVVKVIPQRDYSVIVYFSNGAVKKYDVKPLLDKGVFKKISDIEVFMNTCKVMGHTVAWDINGNFDEYNCIDICPDVLYMDSIALDDFDVT